MGVVTSLVVKTRVVASRVVTSRRMLLCIAFCVAVNVFVIVARLMTSPPSPPDHFLLGARPTTRWVPFGGAAPSPTTPPPPPSPAPPLDVSIVLHDPELCRGEPRWLVYVHSAPENAGRRLVLRHTWANVHAYRPPGAVRVVFVLGRPYDASAAWRDALAGEAAAYRDILLGDFVDHYHNLTLKALFALKWLTLHCPGVPHVLKTDDDTFVDLPWLMTRPAPARTVTCVRHTRMPILRANLLKRVCAKWCVHDSILPGKRLYPPYCAGLAHVLSGDIVSELYAAARVTNAFWIDDVFLTGMALAKLRDVTIDDVRALYTSNAAVALLRLRTTGPLYRIVHVPNMVLMYRMWSCLLRRRLEPGSSAVIADGTVNRTVLCPA